MLEEDKIFKEKLPKLLKTFNCGSSDSKGGKQRAAWWRLEGGKRLKEKENDCDVCAGLICSTINADPTQRIVFVDEAKNKFYERRYYMGSCALTFNNFFLTQTLFSSLFFTSMTFIIHRWDANSVLKSQRKVANFLSQFANLGFNRRILCVGIWKLRKIFHRFI